RRDAHAEVVLLAVTETEGGVERTEAGPGNASNVEAEADTGRQLGIARQRGKLERAIEHFRIGLLRPQIVFAKTRQGADLRVVGKRRDGADVWIRCGAA